MILTNKPKQLRFQLTLKHKGNMKTKLMLVLMMVFTLSAYAQVNVPCLTMEQTNAQNAQYKANAIVVRDTASQQLQCHYQQLATYWQQLHKDNQQKAKDIQQIAKDKQQIAKDIQQIEADYILAERAAALNLGGTYDELLAFIEIIFPYLGSCDESLKKELTRIHTNRSGQNDGTNPGGQTGNINGFDNPGYIIKNK